MIRHPTTSYRFLNPSSCMLRLSLFPFSFVCFFSLLAIIPNDRIYPCKFCTIKVFFERPQCVRITHFWTRISELASYKDFTTRNNFELPYNVVLQVWFTIFLIGRENVLMSRVPVYIKWTGIYLLLYDFLLFHCHSFQYESSDSSLFWLMLPRPFHCSICA